MEKNQGRAEPVMRLYSSRSAPHAPGAGHPKHPLTHAFSPPRGPRCEHLWLLSVVWGTPYQPHGTGFDALDGVDWSRLKHCYGRGIVSIGDAGDVSLAIAGDVSRSLATLRTDPYMAIGDGLYSNICHQGTVYQATAYRCPLLQLSRPATFRTGSAYHCWRSWATSRSERAI